mgnify:CR=1 FL=1
MREEHDQMREEHDMTDAPQAGWVGEVQVVDEEDERSLGAGEGRDELDEHLVEARVQLLRRQRRRRRLRSRDRLFAIRHSTATVSAK